MNSRSDTTNDALAYPGILAICLYVLAAICSSAGALVGIWWAFFFDGTAELATRTWQGLLMMFLGCLMAGLLWALGYVVRALHEIADRRRREMFLLQDLLSRQDPPMPLGALAEDAPLDPSPEQTTPESQSRWDGQRLEELRDLLIELNTNTLLSPEQREAKRLRKQSQQAEQLSRQVHRAIRDEQFETAEELLQQLAGEVPDDPHVAELEDQIAEARRQRRQAVLEHRMREVTDLMSIARFAQARQVAEDLLDVHPDDEDVRQLLTRVEREEEAYTQEKIRRHSEEINSFATVRQWGRALESARRLVTEYPDCTEATQANAMMPTLIDNARIEEVRTYRDRFLGYMERKRYVQALEIARHVVENFPETAAAEELRSQLPRLESLAARAL